MEITTQIKCEVFQLPEAERDEVRYMGDEQGIPQACSAEITAETGAPYTIVSPLSPYALGTELWQDLRKRANGRDFSDVFSATIDWDANTITVREVQE